MVARRLDALATLLDGNYRRMGMTGVVESIIELHLVTAEVTADNRYRTFGLGRCH